MMTEDKQPISVLCIEDERFISDLYTRALTNAGYTVTVISDGAAALTEAQKGIYDIVLLDIMLPSMNGVELLHSLKDPNRQPPLTSKIIITTNLDQEESARKQVEQLADGYLIKAEITPRELVTYLQQISF